jgi:MoaA/NifB/PqqE/SkfB family radical SAM enzyme
MLGQNVGLGGAPSLLIVVHPSIHKENLDEIEDIVKLVIEVGAESITFGVLYAVGRAKSAEGILLDHRDIELISKK